MSIGLGNVVWAVVALGVVLGLVGVAARGVRWTGVGRGGGGGTGGRLTVAAAVPLDRARRLVLVRCDGREVLLLTGGGADVVVGWLPAPGGAA